MAGLMALAAVGVFVTFNQKTNSIESENYSSEPVRLNNLVVEARN